MRPLSAVGIPRLQAREDVNNLGKLPGRIFPSESRFSGLWSAPPQKEAPQCVVPRHLSR